MRAMRFHSPARSLRLHELEVPTPTPDQLLIKVHACGVCRTDLHIFDGELPHPKPNLIPGHQIVGSVVEAGAQTTRYQKGDRVGIPWLARSCGNCRYCQEGAENLCDHALFTGYSIDGGYADYCVAYEQFCFPLSSSLAPIEIAPLLCAGMIGYRSYKMVEEGHALGFYGFGAAAHLLMQVTNHAGKAVYAFTREGDSATQRRAIQLGAVWAGNSNELPPNPLDGAIIFAPVGTLVPHALRAVKKGGTVVCAGIHMSDIPSFPYAILWEERVVRSVANLTRADGDAYLPLAAKIPIIPQIHSYPLEEANAAVEAVRSGSITGSAVLAVSDA